MKFSEEIDFRDGLFYDAAIKGIDTNFWATDSGALGTASGKIRWNADAASTYAEFLMGDFEFALNVPVSPAAGQDKKWGLINAGDTNTRGAAYFQLDSDVFYANIVDEAGNRSRAVIAFDSNAWDGAEKRYRIIWESNGISFMVNDTQVAFLGDRGGSPLNVTQQLNTTIPQAIRIVNNNADNLDFGFLNIRGARKVI